MTTYEDLTPYEYFPDTPGTLVNIGWLGRGQAYETGESPGLADAVLRLAAFHRENVTRGFHLCEWCEHAPDYDPMLLPYGNDTILIGGAEIHVPGPDGVVYAAPTLVFHYITDHGYLPPAEFVEAALAEARRCEQVCTDH